MKLAAFFAVYSTDAIDFADRVANPYHSISHVTVNKIGLDVGSQIPQENKYQSYEGKSSLI